MRILHVAESVMGGCGTYLNQIVQAQLEDPAISAIRVILPNAHAAQVPDIPPAMLHLFACRDRSLRSLAVLASAISEEVRSFRPDCVHLHSTFAGLVGRLVLAFTPNRPRIVYCAHGWAFDMDRAGAKNRLIGWLEVALAPLCDRIVAISEYERQRGIDVGIAPSRISTVLNGIADAPPAQAPVGGDIRRVLFIGRLDRQKGIDVLLDAVAGAGDRIELRVVGAGVVGDQHIASEAMPQVKLLGWCDQERSRAELEWADLVVIPSRWEGFGLVAIEAMRAGRAVVASAVGGLPEVVVDGTTGVLVPPGDAEKLRAALLGFDQATLVAMGKAGRTRFSEYFTVARTADELFAIYQAITRARG